MERSHWRCEKLKSNKIVEKVLTESRRIGIKRPAGGLTLQRCLILNKQTKNVQSTLHELCLLSEEARSIVRMRGAVYLVFLKQNWQCIILWETAGFNLLKCYLEFSTYTHQWDWLASFLKMSCYVLALSY